MASFLMKPQYVPEIFTWLKTAVDAQPDPGKYVITGSQQFHLMEKITESLAGRSALVTLLPFTVDELKSAGLQEADPFALLLKRLYPSLYDR
ncbi:MAG: AAA family ATPase [Treponema sp.]|jgi:predicted AAA+ superfamily ATPase|nr:AAA family ATPase [Treponema sp.]